MDVEDKVHAIGLNENETDVEDGVHSIGLPENEMDVKDGVHEIGLHENETDVEDGVHAIGLYKNETNVVDSCISYFGRCFSIDECKKHINAMCTKTRFNCMTPGEMKYPINYHIFASVMKVRLKSGLSVKEGYMDFLTKLLNLNPSQAEHSFQDGLTYIDNSQVKTYYLIESYFNVRLRIFELRQQTKHCTCFTTTKKRLKVNNNLLHLYPYNTCRRKVCYFMTAKYLTNLEDYNLPTLNIIISSLDHIIKKTKHILYFVNESFLKDFMQIFEPLMGLSTDRLQFRSMSTLTKDEQKQLDISTELDIVSIKDIYYNENKFKISSDKNIVIITAICFPFSQGFHLGKIYRLIRLIKQDGKLNNRTKVLIFNPIGGDKFNILISENIKIEAMYEYGPKNEMVSIKTLKGLKTSLNKRETNIDGKCPCEKFGNKTDISLNKPYDFMSVYQYPLKFSKKSLPIYFSLFDMDNMLDFAKRLELASKLSNLFYDIESLREQVLNVKNTDPGIYLGYQELKDMIHGYHKIIMIGYEDCLSEEIISWASDDKKNIVALEALLKHSSYRKIFHIGNNEKDGCIEEPTFDNQTLLIKSFIEFIFERSLLIKKIKSEIMKPIISYAEKLMTIEKAALEDIETENEETRFNSNSVTEVKKLFNALEIFINETVLWGFNSAKYDNVIIMPYLKYLLNIDKQSLFYYKNFSLFRRGRIISNVSIKYNAIRITFRDFLNIENPYTSLEDMAKKYNIVHSKAVFPHNLSDSVRRLKLCSSMPKNQKFWKLMSGDVVSKKKQQDAMNAFNLAGVKNMYEYMTYYLYLDVTVLRECYFAYQDLLFKTENWDIIANKCYTISSLMYEKNYKQQFINNWKQMAVYEIKNEFVKSILDHSIMGGITVCMFSGLIGKNPSTNSNSSFINSHLKYKDVKDVSRRWPGLYMHKEEVKKKHGNMSNLSDQDLIHKTFPARYLHSYDMLSLYASAMYHPIPIGPCRQWNYGYRNTEGEFQINCPIRNDYEPHKDEFSALHRSKTFIDTEEAKFIYTYMHDIFDHDKYMVQRINSSLHVGGCVTFEYKSVPDLFIKAQERTTNVTCYFVVNYDGIYYHGIHKQHCIKYTRNIDEKQREKEIQSKQKHSRRKDYYNHLFSCRPDNKSVKVFYQIMNSCDMGYCQRPTIIVDDSFFFNLNKKSITHSELVCSILRKDVRGFIVINNLKIDKSDQNPSLGFAIQKTRVKQEWLSPHSKELLSQYSSKMGLDFNRVLKQATDNEKILCLHEYIGPVSLHTDYFLFLWDNFVLNTDFRILHVLEFCHSDFLRNKVDSYIKRRFEVKDKIKTLEKQQPNSSDISYLKAVSSVLKLYNNSLYGYSLLRPDNYKSTKFIISHRLDFIAKENVVKARLIKKVSNKNFIVMIERTSKPLTTQAHVGSTIMTRSKITFLSSVLFILEKADPALLECLYMDTDSIHFCTYYRTLEDNILNIEKKNLMI